LLYGPTVKERWYCSRSGSSVIVERDFYAASLSVL